eukprot:TRINITY_DN42069_c0_g1_i1.p1 TRINITY_DN42069_c0_g1~~TRINITY_DN42069_c0_g1_i1.p1  ORF type:complete len:706 (-),score=133.70 TRINITY_DN42069_c0_g1_i1:250-2250(-)
MAETHAVDCPNGQEVLDAIELLDDSKSGGRRDGHGPDHADGWGRPAETLDGSKAESMAHLAQLVLREALQKQFMDISELLAERHIQILSEVGSILGPHQTAKLSEKDDAGGHLAFVLKQGTADFGKGTTSDNHTGAMAPAHFGPEPSENNMMSKLSSTAAAPLSPERSVEVVEIPSLLEFKPRLSHKPAIPMKQLPHEMDAGFVGGESKTSEPRRDASTASTSSALMPRGRKTRIKKLTNAFDEETSRVTRFVEGPYFECFFAIVIVMSTVLMCLEAQYNGIDMGYQLGFSGYHRPAAEVWPHAREVFDVMEYVFGFVFLIEVCLKLFALRVKFLLSGWDLLDLAIVVIWFAYAFGSVDLGINPFIVRLFRLLPMFRLVRFVKAFQIFDVLRLLVSALQACSSVFLWSLLLLFVIMVVCGLILHIVVKGEILDGSLTEAATHDLFVYFGTFSRTILSMYEVTFGNWSKIGRALHENISEWFAPLILAYRLVVSFAMLKVINGIFLSETLRVMNSNDEILIMHKTRQTERHISNMQQLFIEADDSGDGLLSFEEFKGILADSRVKTWLEAQEIELNDVQLVFDLVGNERGAINAEELVLGFARMKGAARSVDMLSLMQRINSLCLGVNKILEVKGLSYKPIEYDHLPHPIYAFLNKKAPRADSYRTP